MPERTASVSEPVAAPPGVVYDLISDVTRMRSWSPETRRCAWLGGATGPAVGARFKGTNTIGWRRWSTTCTVTAADPGSAFAFRVQYGPMVVAEWRYDIAPDGAAGSLVTESWRDRRPAWFRAVYPVLVGVKDRAEHNRATMTETLRRLKAAAERG